MSELQTPIDSLISASYSTSKIVHDKKNSKGCVKNSVNDAKHSKPRYILQLLFTFILHYVLELN